MNQTATNARGVDTSSFAKKTDLANWKINVDKLDIDKLKIVPNNLSSLKNEADKSDVDKLVLLPVVGDVVKTDAVIKHLYYMLR